MIDNVAPRFEATWAWTSNRMRKVYYARHSGTETWVRVKATTYAALTSGGAKMLKGGTKLA